MWEVAGYTTINSEARPIIAMPKGYAIASVHLVSGETRRDANAALFAASKELLAACQLAILDPGIHDDTKKVIRAAIAKATQV